MDRKVNVIILVIVAAVMLGVGYTMNEMVNKLFSDANMIEIVKSNTCEGAKLYYEGEDYDIYTYCLDSIKAKRENELVQLDELFEMDDILENIYEKLMKVSSYKDGGSIMYRSDEENISILKCNTIDGNKDIYIGDGTMEYENGFCENREEKIHGKNFGIDLEVLLVSPCDEENKYLTVRIKDTNEVATVKVKADEIETIKKVGVYNFSFETEKSSIKKDIDSIFKSARIVSVKKSN